LCDVHTRWRWPGTVRACRRAGRSAASCALATRVRARWAAARPGTDADTRSAPLRTHPRRCVQGPLVPSNPADIPQALLASPTVAKSLAGVTVALYALGQLVPSVESVLAIKATNTYGAHSYVWNVFTAGFFSTSILLALATALVYLVMGRFLVPAWGSVEFLRFIFFSNFFTGIIIFFTQVAWPVRAHLPGMRTASSGRCEAGATCVCVCVCVCVCARARHPEAPRLPRRSCTTCVRSTTSF